MESTNTVVKPPANGKKLWRVKRVASGGSKQGPDSPDNSSIECLQNSLKIAAAGRAYSMKRAPLKRPKNKPGKPKDFVFVDLSPIKQSPLNTEDEGMISGSESSLSPVSFTSEGDSSYRSFSFDDSISSSGSDDDSVFSGVQNYNLLDTLDGESNAAEYMQDFDKCAHPTENFTTGLGISGIDWQSNSLFHPNFSQESPDHTMDTVNMNYTLFSAQDCQLQQMQQMQLDYLALQQQLQSLDNSFGNLHYDPPSNLVNNKQIQPPSPPKSNLESPKKKTICGLQFKTYKGPGVKKSKSSVKHRNTISDASSLNGISKVNSSNRTKSSKSVSPKQEVNVTIPQLDSPMLPNKRSLSAPGEKFNSIDQSVNPSCGIDEFLYQRLDEVDLTPFVSF